MDGGTVQGRNVVFVVASDHDKRVSIRLQLEAAGHFVISATSARDALELIGKLSTPSFVIIGRNLIQMEPEQFVMELRKHEAFESIPIAQVGASQDPLKPGILCNVDVNNLEPVIKWLRQNSTQSDWNL